MAVHEGEWRNLPWRPVVRSQYLQHRSRHPTESPAKRAVLEAPIGTDFAEPHVMSRPLRISYPGAFHHVMARGNGKSRIVLDDGDRLRFLEILDEVHGRFGLLCHTYCLMENHYHLVVETPTGGLSAAIKHLNGVYAQWWNRTHGRCGHLLQGRFKGQLVQQDRYLRAVCRYVVLNPPRAGLAEHPRDWRWSSYRATAGIEPPPRFLSTALLHSLVATPGDPDPGAAFERFVALTDDLDIGSSIRRDVRCLGSESFWLATVATFAAERDREVPRREYARPAPALARLIKPGATLDARNRGIWMARVEYGYGTTEIARHLGVNSETVRRAVRGTSPPGVQA